MQKLANYVAEMAGVEVVQALIRGNNAVQVGASMEKRQKQAKTAYIAKTNIDLDASYLLVDDV